MASYKKKLRGRKKRAMKEEEEDVTAWIRYEDGLPRFTKPSSLFRIQKAPSRKWGFEVALKKDIDHVVVIRYDRLLSPLTRWFV